MTHPKATPADSDDETLMTEITIRPDGRVFVFGTSRQALEILRELDPGDPRVTTLLCQVTHLEGQGVR